jgi:hypothetical protein
VDTIENDNYSSQLRSLRLLLGRNFRPISTAALASLAGIPPVSIHGIEAGRRKLNDEDRENIEIHLGARWNTQSHQWVYALDPETPYSRMEYETYSSQLITSHILSRENQDRFSEALDYLLTNLEGKEAALALFKLHRELLRIADQNNVAPEALEAIQRFQPVLTSKRINLPARDKALADLETPPTSAGKKRKAKH